MLLCQPLIALTEYRTHNCLAIHNFLPTLGNSYQKLKNNNNNKIIVIILKVSSSMTAQVTNQMQPAASAS